MSLEVKNLTKVYGQGHTAVKALDDVSIKVNAGDILLIMGPSGSGKTTLLSMIGTLLKPSSGSISINNQTVTDASEGQLHSLRLKEIGFVFQNFNLLSALTAEQNVMIPLVASGYNKKQAAQKAKELLTKLSLQHRLHNIPKDLSGGEKQRVAIARALANEPNIILADEPTANLDSKTGSEVMELLCEIACTENKAVIIVSHDQRLKTVARRIITIEDGRLKSEERGGHDGYCKMKQSTRK